MTAGHSVVSFYLPDWRDQSLFIAAFMLPFGLTYYVLPDSFQSSFSNGDIAAGEASLKTFAKAVGFPLDDKSIQAYSQKFCAPKEASKHGDTIFSGRNMAMLLCLVTSLETLSTFCWFGYLLMPDGTYFSFYVDVIVNAISDTVFCLAATFLDKLGTDLFIAPVYPEFSPKFRSPKFVFRPIFGQNRGKIYMFIHLLGRRGSMLSTSSVGGILLVAAFVLQAHAQLNAARWLNFVTRGVITCMNLTALAYKSEALPTTVRTNGVAFGQVVAKLTSISGPLII